MKARLTKNVPRNRIALISGNCDKLPTVGDIGETDQRFTGKDGRPMVFVYFESADGSTEWEVEAYESELAYE
jgi:hypothetical protein